MNHDQMDLTFEELQLLESVSPDQARRRLQLERLERGIDRPTPKALRPRCGAKTRAGRPCAAPCVWDATADRPRNGRCKLHGGLSTGPRTPEGFARREAGFRRWVEEQRRRRASRRATRPDPAEVEWQMQRRQRR